MTKGEKAIQIYPGDNVAVALEDLCMGMSVLQIELKEDIPSGHKFALCDIKKYENVIKYGYPIGHASIDISKGFHVHVHNIETNLKGLSEYTYKPSLLPKEKADKVTFQGYKRENGKAGIRNEIWIINTVGCVNKIAEQIAKAANEKYKGRCDGIFTYVHPFGCSQLGDDQIHTQKTLKGLVNHPNAAAVLVLGLGCENNNIPEFKKILGSFDERRVKFLNAQDFDDEVEQGLKELESLVAYTETFKREPIDIAELVVGLKCGGSDGLSGITANPLVGRFSDMLIAHGGTTILTEVPEMFGAETILMNRCENESLFYQTVDLINDMKSYFIRHEQEIYKNPSPGNKSGGISTLEDKSLGCVQKGGRSNVTAVLRTGETAEIKGLNLLSGPGNDIVSITELTAAGAHIVLFTTGRGTPVGAPVPTVKVASNSNLTKRKPTWIDFNAGALLEGRTMEDVAKDFLNYIVDLADGNMKTNNEKKGYKEISIFKDGVVL